MSIYQQLLAALSGAPTQHNRLLKLHTPLGTDVLLAERVQVVEAVGPAPVQPDLDSLDAAPACGLRVEVHALCADTHLELKSLMGQPVLVELLTQLSRSDLRPFHGHVTSVALLGSDGGLARYRLVLEPWLSFLAQRVDSWVFQGQSVLSIIEEVFGDYRGGALAPAWRFDLADASVYPTRSLCVQYQETDLAFVQRLLLEEGLFCWWEFAGDASAASLGSHTLVIADHNGAVKVGAQGRVRYTQTSSALPEDSLVRWRDARRVRAGAVALASRDYRTGSASSSLRPSSQTSAGGLPELAQSDVPGLYVYEDGAQGERLSLRQMQSLDASRTRVWAAGSLRTAAVGTSFTLADHPVHSGLDATRDSFAVLAVSHVARSNLSADLKAQVLSLVGAIALDKAGRDVGVDRVLTNETEEPLYRCDLVVQPLVVPIRMAALDALGLPDPRLHPRPTVHGVQTALVVGLGEPVHVDRDHRIKVQFHWQRGGNSSHRLSSPSGDNAPASDASGTWVRVAERIAGSNWGSVFTPRLGQEVLISFVGGDIDRPVVVGALYNGLGQVNAQHNQIGAGAAKATGDAPAWFPGDKSAGELESHQHAAVLTGFKTQELASSASGTGGYNQLVLDDSPGQARTELFSSNAQTRLQLGHLLHQVDNQRLNKRGHGIDLATQAWGAVRAAQGILISAHGRPSSNASAKQMDGREPLSQLEQSQQLLHTLAESAQQHKAKGKTSSGKDEPDVVGAKEPDTARQLPNEKAHYASLKSLKATATKGDVAGGEKEIGGGAGTVAAWGRPDLVAAAPGGVALISAGSSIFSSGNTTTLVAGQDLMQSAVRHHATAVKAGVVMFTYGKAQAANKPNKEVGIAIHSSTGSWASHSLTAATKVTADKAITVSSTQSRVLISAPKHVLLTAAGAAIRIEGANITLTAPGKVEFKASMKELAGGGSMSTSISLPRTTLDIKRFARYPVSI
jgi:type VI secretion system secreted protein VgrG